MMTGGKTTGLSTTMGEDGNNFRQEDIPIIEEVDPEKTLPMNRVFTQQLNERTDPMELFKYR